MKKYFNKAIKIIFILSVFLFVSIIGFKTLGNSREVSELEGRMLQTFVTPDAESVMSGEFANKTDSAFSDQIEGRDFFVRAYYKLNFKTYTGDVAQGSDNQLFCSQQKINDEQKYYDNLNKIADKINTFADELSEQGRKFIFVSIPRKDAVMTEYLPSAYTSSDEIYKSSMSCLCERFNDNVKVIDCYELFSASDKNCYFTTDHHMNINGAMLVYNELLEYINEDYPDCIALSIDDYNVSAVTVNGSFNRLIGQRVKAEPEELVISLKNMNFSYERFEDGKPSGKAIWGSNTTTYAGAYMSDDNPYTVVKTSNEKYPNILFSGGSFTNILETLMVPNCHIMASVDYRYNDSGISLSDYAKENSADYVIYIPSQSNDAFGYSKMLEHLGY